MGDVAVKPFEAVKHQIGYCGIWCGSCVAGNGALRELTGRFADVIGNYGLEEWVPPCFDFKEFSKGLESIEDMPLCGGCRSGDGSPDCPMRLCAIDRGVEDCIECGQHEVCGNTERFEKMRTGAVGAGLVYCSSRRKRIHRRGLQRSIIVILRCPSCRVNPSRAQGIQCLAFYAE
jgi:hypothetical protein